MAVEIRTNTAQATPVFVNDLGYFIPASGGAVTLTTRLELDGVQNSERVVALATDDAFGAGDSTLILFDGTNVVGQDDVNAFLSNIELDRSQTPYNPGNNAGGLPTVFAAANFFEAGGGQVIAAGPTAVQFDTDRLSTPGFSITGGDTITMIDSAFAGRYLIITIASAKTSGSNNRTQYQSFVTLNGTEIAGTRAELYLRQANYGANGVNIAVGDLVLNDDIQVLLVRTAGGASAQVDANGAAIVLVRLGDTP